VSENRKYLSTNSCYAVLYDVFTMFAENYITTTTATSKISFAWVKHRQGVVTYMSPVETFVIKVIFGRQKVCLL